MTTPTPRTAEALLEAMTEAVYVVDRSRRITYWNHAAEELTGWSADQVVGHRCHDGILNHVDDNGTELCRRACPLRATMSDRVPRRASIWLHHRDGHRIPVEVSAAALRDDEEDVVGAVEVFHSDARYRDAAAALDDARSELLIDPLTRVGNRRALAADMRRFWSALRRDARGFAVLFIDVDHFKNVNDTHGHEVGDRVLQTVAATIVGCIRPTDVLARWGGEEFVVLTAADTDAAATALAERTRRVCSTAWLPTETGPVGVTVSIGVAVARRSDTTSTLMRRADGAMYQAKEAGRDRVVLAPSA